MVVTADPRDFLPSWPPKGTYAQTVLNVLTQTVLEPGGFDRALPKVVHKLDEIVTQVEADILIYPARRDGYVALQLWLNQQRRIAPAFRPHARLKGFRFGTTEPVSLTKEQEQIAFDRQFIDLHWLHENGLSPINERLRAAMDNWDQLIIAEFIRKRLKTKTRIHYLGLQPELQIGNLNYIDPLLWKMRADIDRQRSGIEHALRQKMAGDKRYKVIRNLDRIGRLWMARELARHLNDSVSEAHVGHWYMQMTGMELTRTAQRNGLGQVGRYIDGTKGLKRLVLPAPAAIKVDPGALPATPKKPSEIVAEVRSTASGGAWTKSITYFGHRRVTAEDELEAREAAAREKEKEIEALVAKLK
jgi:hypothetical protein